MKDPGIDAEKLAALMDGRLDERERAELLARLASSEDALEIYADATAALREAEAGEAKVLPLTPPARRAERWRTPARRWLAAAAILAGVAVGGPLLWTRVRSPVGEEPGRSFAPLVGDGIGLPAGWDESPWTTVRGGGVAEPLTPTARAARVGARIVDLEIAVWSRDTAAPRLASEVAALLEGVPAGAPVATMYRVLAQRAGRSPEELEPLLERGRLAASKLVGADVFRLAAWAEAGRVAAARRSAEFFRTRESRLLLEWASRLPSLPDAAGPVVRRLQGELPPGDPPDWGALEHDVTELLRVLGS